jgi:MFS family permease
VTAIQHQFSAGALALGLSVSAALIGWAVGAWSAGQIADRIGRPLTMVVAAILLMVQSLGAGLELTLWDLSFGRFLGGVGGRHRQCRRARLLRRVIFYYSSVLWQAVGFSENDSLKITIITSVTNIATTLIAIALVDRVGRRPLLLTGSAGRSVTLVCWPYCRPTCAWCSSGCRGAPPLSSRLRSVHLTGDEQ